MKEAEKTSRPESAAELTGRVVWQTVKTPALRKLVNAVVREALRDWAQDSKFKARMTDRVEEAIGKVLAAEGDGGGKTGAELGKLMTAFARETNEALRGGVKAVADPQKTAINDFIVNTDFGELKEMVDRSEAPLLQNLDIAIECIWKYPAKVGSILAAVVSAGNISIKGIAMILSSLLDNLGPDLTADILLSVVRELRGKEIGKLVNTLAELLRRLHTGSYLLARGGKPLFEIYLTDFLKDAAGEIDPAMFTKARVALAEDAETIARSLAEMLAENEKLLWASLEAYAALTNPKIKTQAVKLHLYENADPEKFIEAAAAGISDLDTQLMAENFNAVLRIINALHEAKPELFDTLLRGFADSVDEDELQKTVGWLVPEMVRAFKSLAPAAMPALINGFCEMVRADDSAETREALRNLRSVILDEGGAQ
jgi:DNA-directed RNA polymerase subunit L